MLTFVAVRACNPFCSRYLGFEKAQVKTPEKVTGSGKKRCESRVPEVLILAQGLAQAQLPHDDKAETVGEGPCGTDIFDEQTLRFLKPLGLHPHDSACLEKNGVKSGFVINNGQPRC
jgi:hypothetical protein